MLDDLVKILHAHILGQAEQCLLGLNAKSLWNGSDSWAVDAFDTQNTRFSAGQCGSEDHVRRVLMTREDDIPGRVNDGTRCQSERVGCGVEVKRCLLTSASTPAGERVVQTRLGCACKVLKLPRSCERRACLVARHTAQSWRVLADLVLFGHDMILRHPDMGSCETRNRRGSGA